MKMTPTEIRKKSFEKNFRGYDKDEVSNYLNTIAEELESLTEEKKDLQRKLDQSEKEGAKLKQVEESLFKTLKTAEDTGASIIEEANQAADHILTDAHQNAEAMYNDAQRQSQALIQNAESRSREIMRNIKTDVTAMVESYDTMIHQRELVLKTLKKLSEDINDNITVSQNEFKKVNVQAHAQLVMDLSKSNSFAKVKVSEIKQEEPTKETPMEQVREEKAPEAKVTLEQIAPQPVEEVIIKKESPKANIHYQEEPVAKEASAKEAEKENSNNKKDGSFFDQLD